MFLVVPTHINNLFCQQWKNRAVDQLVLLCSSTGSRYKWYTIVSGHHYYPTTAKQNEGYWFSRVGMHACK